MSFLPLKFAHCADSWATDCAIYDGQDLKKHKAAQIQSEDGVPLGAEDSSDECWQIVVQAALVDLR